MTTSKTITFFLGAGFSKPGGYPLALDLDTCIKLIFKSSSKECEYLLDAYEKIGLPFNYEEFYDFFMSFGATSNPVKYVSPEMIASFESFIGGDESKRVNKIANIEEVFNSLLYEKFYWIENTKEKHEDYIDFIKFIKCLIESENIFRVNIFSLNHDRLIENLFSKYSIPYSDGFEKEELRFYIKRNQANKVFHFTGEYKEKLRLYKLHGSVDLFSSIKEKKLYWLKVEKNDNMKFYRDAYLIDKEGKHSGLLLSPRFLTGREMKLPFYSMIEHFKNSLGDLKRGIEGTNKLIIIGYGFGDEHIQNKYLKQSFHKMGVVTVIDKFKEERDETISDKKNKPIFLEENVNYYCPQKYVQDISVEEYLNIIK